MVAAVPSSELGLQARRPLLAYTPTASIISLLAQRVPRSVGGQCSNSVPQLNVIEASDEYFGRENTSVSTPVASADVGYGEITGNCHAAYTTQES